MSAEQRADRLLIASILGGAALTALAAWGFEVGLLPDVVAFLAAGTWMVSFYAAFIHLANVSRG